MTPAPRPFRSVLYIPGSNARALDKARSLPADAIIFDLEDAVAADRKDEARETLAEALREDGYGDRARLVRINALDTDWGADDLAGIAETRPEAILLPKVGAPEDIEALVERFDSHPGLGETRVWAMMESADGVFNADSIARAPRIEGFVVGTNDLAAEMNCRPGPDRAELMVALQTCILAAKAARILCVDGVYNAFRDEEGLRAECAQGVRLGMDGKSLIHPSQVPVANDVFSPSEDEIDLARRQIAAWDEARAEGRGVAVVAGRIVENLHVATARATLARAGQ